MNFKTKHKQHQSKHNIKQQLISKANTQQQTNNRYKRTAHIKTHATTPQRQTQQQRQHTTIATNRRSIKRTQQQKRRQSKNHSNQKTT